jgi:hypothetical protein
MEGRPWPALFCCLHEEEKKEKRVKRKEEREGKKGKEKKISGKIFQTWKLPGRKIKNDL